MCIHRREKYNYAVLQDSKKNNLWKKKKSNLPA